MMMMVMMRLVFLASVRRPPASQLLHVITFELMANALRRGVVVGKLKGGSEREGDGVETFWQQNDVLE